jgi:type III secretory pathway component EscT
MFHQASQILGCGFPFDVITEWTSHVSCAIRIHEYGEYAPVFVVMCMADAAWVLLDFASEVVMLSRAPSYLTP